MNLKPILAVFCGMAFFVLATPVCGFAETTYTNPIGMEFVRIPAGSFEREIPEKKDGKGRVVTPAKKVTITIRKPFYLGKYEVTAKQWTEVRKNYPAEEKRDIRYPESPKYDKHPITGSWLDAQDFIYELTYVANDGYYRLPTDAEWEYAAKGGTDTLYFFGDDPAMLGDYAWYGKNSNDEVKPVGKKKANPFGLYDIYGNVQEWVLDWNDDFAQQKLVDPSGPLAGFHRIVRGGYVGSDPQYGPIHRRLTTSPYSSDGNMGFRLVYIPYK